MKKTTTATLAGLTAALMLVFASPALAQGWGVQLRLGNERAWTDRGHARAAYDNGYRRGVMRGERDARSGRLLRFSDHGDYRGGDWGFTIRFGSRDYYRRAFREGFEAGYREAFWRFERRWNRGVGPRGGYRR